MICLTAGAYGMAGGVTISDVNAPSTVELRPAPGAAVALGPLNLGNDVHNLAVDGFSLTGGMHMTGGGSHLVFAHDTTSHASTGYYFYSNGGRISDVQILHDDMNNIDTADLSGPGDGQCVTMLGNVSDFTIAHDVCGPGIANHYTQTGGITGLTVDANTFTGPRIVHAGVHNNVLQVFGSSSNIDFSNNVIRDSGAQGQTVLIQSGHFANVTFTNNLFDHETSAYAVGMCPVDGLTFAHNTVVDSLWGVQLFNDGGDPACAQSSSDATITHNIIVGTSGGTPDLSYGECSGRCTVAYNVTSDGSARAVDRQHHSVGHWHARWRDTVWYQPAGLPFPAGYVHR